MFISRDVKAAGLKSFSDVGFVVFTTGAFSKPLEPFASGVIRQRYKKRSSKNLSAHWPTENQETSFLVLLHIHDPYEVEM